MAQNTLKKVDIKNCTYYYLDDLINIKHHVFQKIMLDENLCKYFA